MHIKINKITPIYKDWILEPIGAEISYNLILIDNRENLVGALETDNQLAGTIVIYNSDPNIGANVMEWSLYEFNQYIFKNIMKGM